MSWSLIAHGLAEEALFVPDVDFPSFDATGVDLIVVSAAYNTAPGPTLSVDDDEANAYTPLTEYVGGLACRFWVCENPTVSSSLVISCHDTNGFSRAGWKFQAWSSGGVLSSSFDQESGYYESSGTPSRQPGSVTPSVDGELIISALQSDGDTQAIDSGFTITDATDAGTSNFGGMAYLIQSTAAGVNPTWSYQNPGQAGYIAIAIIATFRPATTSVELLRPDADVTDGGWTNEVGGTALYASIDETIPDDADFIQSSLSPVNDTSEVALSNPAGSLVAPIKARIRYYKTEGQAIDLTVSLVQGAVVVAGPWTYLGITTSVFQAEETLTAPEVAAITDFTDLRFRYTANAP